MFGFLVCFSHPLLSLGNGWQIVFQVSGCTKWCAIFSYIFFIFRLDYCGIALLIMGSFVPWLYYGFYCHYQHKLIYLSVVVVLGIVSIIVSLWDKFSEPNLRPLRAGAFMSFGLSGVIPAIHYGLMEGWFSKISQASLGWLVLMGKCVLHTFFLSTKVKATRIFRWMKVTKSIQINNECKQWGYFRLEETTFCH